MPIYTMYKLLAPVTPALAPNLRRDVAPIMLAAYFLEILLQKCSHRDNAIRHTLDLPKPLLVESLVIEDLASYTSAMDWWVGIKWPDENLELRIDTLFFFRRLADYGKRSNPLPIQTLHPLVNPEIATLHVNIPCSWRNSATDISYDPH